MPHIHIPDLRKVSSDFLGGLAAMSPDDNIKETKPHNQGPGGLRQRRCMQKLTAHEKVEEAQIGLVALVSVVDNQILYDACNIVINDPNFRIQVGSCDHHHTYRGGLMVHTYEVVDIALKMAIALDVNRDVLTTAAIWHDYMKVREYEVDESGKINKTPYRKLVRHVAGSHAEFLLAVAGKGLDPDIQMRIEHALLAHHGRQEWGSPVEPQTLESHLLHSADMISVRFGKDLW